MRLKPTCRTLSVTNSHLSSPYQHKFSTITRHFPRTTRTSQHTLPTDSKIYTQILRACSQKCKKIETHNLFDEKPQRFSQALRTCKIIHTQSLILGIGQKGLLGNSILDLYVKCGDVDFAEKTFVQLEERDVFAWNSVLSMYLRQGLLVQVVQSFGSFLNNGVSPNEFTYAMVLSACAKMLDVEYGRQVHCGVVKTGFECSSFCEGALIDMYAKCNCLIDAQMIFDGAEDLDTVSWTAMISAYVQIGLPEKAVMLFEDMQKIGHEPDQVALVTVLSAYLALGRLGDARELFSQMLNPNVVAWNVMISGHAKRGNQEYAISLFLRMRKSGVRSTRSTLGSVLSAIASLSTLHYGLLIHAEAIKGGLNSNVYVGSALVNMYAKCERMDEAKRLFYSIDERNIVLWNAMLGGYAQNGRAHEVMQLFSHMKESGTQPDEFTYTSILSACAYLEYLEMGSQLHTVIIKNKFASNLFVGNALVDMYAKCGALKEARKQFELIRNRDNVSWNAIIGGYVQDEDEDGAFYMFRRMNMDGIVPDEACLASIISACANVQAVEQGKQVHCVAVKSGLETGIYSGSSLISMYAKCGDIGAAREVFSHMPSRSAVSVNALIFGYTRNNLEEAINLFQEMRVAGLKPTEVTFASLLDACNEIAMLTLGRQIHSIVFKWGLLYGSDILDISLLSMYMNCQRKADSIILFSEFPSPKSRVLWTAIISGYAQSDLCDEALELYQDMRYENVLPDQATFATVLRACAVLSSLRQGREIHSLVFHTGFNLDELTCSALVDMYAKCGDVKSSVQVFDEMSCKNDVISWNSMIVGLAKNGYAEDALNIFGEMKKSKVMPDEVTFLGVLTACSHAGKVSEGREVFDTMVSHYGVRPRLDHHACMVDLLGRWGFLEEAEEFINRLIFEPDAMIWAAFLGACRKHGDEVRGRHAAKKLIELNPHNSSPYVLLSNIYAESGNWKGADSLRREMNEKGVKKFPGYSWL